MEPVSGKLKDRGDHRGEESVLSKRPFVTHFSKTRSKGDLFKQIPHSQSEASGLFPKGTFLHQGLQEGAATRAAAASWLRADFQDSDVISFLSFFGPVPFPIRDHSC